ncbi:MAG: flagellar hook-length control protein FliK [Gemmataceae bacterium]|jgi:flagellar hook-length control protein FliK|nr:flagellar hook-length control protein FliK [Gemmataceae bacterium]
MASTTPVVSAPRTVESTAPQVGNRQTNTEASGFAELLAALSMANIPLMNLQNILTQVGDINGNVAGAMSNLLGQMTSGMPNAPALLAQLQALAANPASAPSTSINDLLNQLDIAANTPAAIPAFPTLVPQPNTLNTTDPNLQFPNQPLPIDNTVPVATQNTQTALLMPPTQNPTAPPVIISGGRTLQNPTPVPAVPVLPPNAVSSLVAPESFVPMDPIEQPIQEILPIINFGFTTNKTPQPPALLEEVAEMSVGPAREEPESINQVGSSEKINVDRLIFQAQFNELQLQQRATVPKKAPGSGEITNAARIANEIVTRAEMISQGTNTEFRLRLDPPELGTIHIRMQLGPEGLRAEMTVSSDAVRQLMESQMPDLQQRLQAANLQLVKFDIQQEQDRQEQQRSWYQQQPAEEEVSSTGQKPFNPRVTPLPTRGALLDIRA